MVPIRLRIAKTKRRSALTIEYSEEQFGIKRCRQQPGELPAEVAQAVRAKGAAQHQRFIHERPGVRVLRILPAEIGEELAGLELEIRRQRHRLQIRFLEFDLGALVFFQFKYEVCEALEIRIHRAVQGNLGVAE